MISVGFHKGAHAHLLSRRSLLHLGLLLGLFLFRIFCAEVYLLRRGLGVDDFLHLFRDQITLLVELGHFFCDKLFPFGKTLGFLVLSHKALLLGKSREVLLVNIHTLGDVFYLLRDLLGSLLFFLGVHDLSSHTGPFLGFQLLFALLREVRLSPFLLHWQHFFVKKWFFGSALSRGTFPTSSLLLF